MKTLLVVASCVGILLLSLASASGEPASGESPSSKLESVIVALERGKYSEALAQLASLPTASLSPQERKRARYLAGHAALKLKRYPEAFQAFGEAVEQYPELGDYAIWNIARLHKELNAERSHVEALRLLLARFPQSRLVPQARLALARELIGITGEIADGIRTLEELLEKHARDPHVPEAYLLLGQGYEALGLHEKAIDVYRILYIRFPASPEADQAAMHTEALLPPERWLPAGLTLIERLERADRFADAGECERAVQEVQYIPLDTLSGGLLARASARLGLCAFRLRRYREATAVLGKFRELLFVDERAAEALYILAMACQKDGRTTEAERTFRQLVGREPQTPWNAKALVALGLLYEAQQDSERAIDAYTELVTRFPTADRADEMAWRIGWLHYARGLFGVAARDFGTAAERFPQSMFVSNGVYWQAKALEKNGGSSPANTLYQRVAREYPYTYYGIRAEEVLLARVSSGSPPGNGISAVAPLAPAELAKQLTLELMLSPAATFHRVRVDELLALRFVEDAKEEVAQLAKDLGESLSEQMLLGRLYLSAGLPLQAMRALSASLSAVKPSDRVSLPLDFWTLLFPQRYWEEVADAARQSRLDPLLILGVIRQESAFNPLAVSRSDARGLMQLLPSTGREVFQRLGLGSFQEDALFDPRVNVRLGAQYLGRMADAHRGNLILALAAYNAGPSRVKRWLQELSIADWDEFIEGLPFEETRGYIKNVLRNYGVYRKLYAYGTADERR